MNDLDFKELEETYLRENKEREINVYDNKTTN